MKIAFYIGSLSQGGAERVCSNLAIYFQKTGNEVVMVNYFQGKNEYKLPNTIKRIYADLTREETSSNRIVNLKRRVQKLRKIWKQEKPDVIVSFIGKTNIMTLATTRGLGIPTVVSVRSNPAREYASRALRIGMNFYFPKAEGVILQTTQAKDFFKPSIQKKAVILPNSLNPKFIKPLYTGERKKEIVTVGRLDDNKNQQMLIEAFTELQRDAQDWHLTIYGDGPNMEKHESYIKEHQMEEYITMMGAQNDIQDKIEKASIFVLPSKQEGMPNALIEAMALGLTCISTDCPCGGPADLIQNGKNGYLIPVNDKEALKQGMNLLMNDEEQRRRLGIEANRIVDVLNPDRVNEMWSTYLLDKVKYAMMK